jgi:hypothetical protein
MLFPKKEITENSHNVRVLWQHENMPWNEICAMVMEVFGLPGNRYTYTPNTHYMIFKFRSEKDKTLCEILLSGYLNV